MENHQKKIDALKLKYIPPEDVEGIYVLSCLRTSVNFLAGIPPVEYSLRLNGRGFLPLGEVTTVTGGPKVGKSSFLALLTTALIKGSFQGLSTRDGKPKSVVWIDTEQGLSTIMGIVEKICKWADLDKRTANRRVTIHQVSGESPAGMRDVVSTALREYEPEVLYIDTGADFLKATKEEDALDFFRWIKAEMTATGGRVNVIVALHLNKTRDADGIRTVRGFIGTEAERKSAEILELTRFGGTTEVRQRLTRHEPGLQPFSFSITEQGVTVSADTGSDNEERRECSNILDKTFRDGGQTRLTLAEIKKHTPAWDGISDNTIRAKLTQAEKWGIIGVERTATRGKKGKRVFYTHIVSELFKEVEDNDC